jgi:predicted nucleic acid-binding protein
LLVDTSAFLALLNESDRAHDRAHAVWDQLRGRDAGLLTTNYVLVETIALLGRRFGPEVVRTFQRDLVPLLEITWVDRRIHERAMAALLTAGLRDLSLGDCVSFEVMREMGIEQAFAFDPHFEQQGFTVISA